MDFFDDKLGLAQVRVHGLLIPMCYLHLDILST